ncbi:MAG: thioredoxin [Candidatus Doudnabacteria bacterium]|nr:thioredoxin [Candidatus Doudnabacteria bacterium]MCA9387784.1 thioredoxin [Candidatus Andersenbacteria bacterium]
MSDHIVDTTSANFEQDVLQSDKPVVVDFWAEWCQPCKMIAPVLEELAGENDSVKIVKVNIEEHGDLAQQHGVMSIPTLMVFKNGEKTNQLVGVQSKEQILAAVA